MKNVTVLALKVLSPINFPTHIVAVDYHFSPQLGRTTDLVMKRTEGTLDEFKVSLGTLLITAQVEESLRGGQTVQIGRVRPVEFTVPDNFPDGTAL